MFKGRVRKFELRACWCNYSKGLRNINTLPFDIQQFRNLLNDGIETCADTDDNDVEMSDAECDSALKCSALLRSMACWATMRNTIGQRNSGKWHGALSRHSV